MRIGAHVSAAGGLSHTLDRAQDIGAECAQIFVGAPQRWAGASYTDEDVAGFAELQALGEQLGFSYVAAGPLVRSSYKAGDFFFERMVRERRDTDVDEKRGSS